MTTLRLTYGSISLTLGASNSPFVQGNFPRERIEGPEFGRTNRGAVTEEGSIYEPPHIWNISARLRPNDAATIKKIYDLWLLKKPREYILLDDLIDPLSESGDRTRALAEGTTEVVEGSGAAAVRTYFAKFNVLFQSEPQRVKDGGWRIATFTLIEGVKVAP